MSDSSRNGFRTVKERIIALLGEPQITKNSLQVILTAAFCLVGIRYLKTFSDLLSFLDYVHLNTWKLGLIELRSNISDHQLFDLAYWALCRLFFYLLIPLFIIKLVFKKQLSNFGWRRAEHPRNSVKIFLVFFAFMLPLVFAVSLQDSFVQKYPFYHPDPQDSFWPELLTWELLYFVQFVSLEFFFRGFMVHGLKKEMGDYSVLLMVIPYCMIHFQKPFLETSGAVFAGLVLGYLSLRKNSIATGVALHFSVAISMDLFALYHQGII